MGRGAGEQWPRGRWGPTTVPGRQQGGDPAAAGDLRLGHRARQGWATGFDSSARADNTSVRAGGVLSVRIPRFSTNLNILRSICSDHGDPARRGSDGGPRRFTAVIPTPHAYSGQWPVKTKRARARSCASVVTRKSPSLNCARKRAWFKTPAIRVTVLALSTGVGSCSGFCLPRSGGISLPGGASPRVGAVGSEPPILLTRTPNGGDSSTRAGPGVDCDQAPLGTP